MASISEELCLELIEEEVRGLHPDAQAIYFEAVANGTAPRMAIMFATHMAPSMKGSDRTLNQTQRRKMERMLPMNRERIVKIAEKAGVRTNGKFYVGGLGRYNDPAAWVSTYDDALSVCKARNLTAEGIVYHQGQKMEPKKVQMAEDIVQGYVQKELEKSPKLREKVRKNPKKLKEVREQVISTHSKKKT
jgi:hypothetical protein